MSKDDKKSKYKEFSFSPDVIKYDPEGYPEIDTAATDHYKCFKTISHGKLYYTPKSNKYWVNPGAEMAPEALAAKMPYLRWKYDELVEETVEKTIEVQDDKGKTKKVVQEVKTGNVINLNPPTPKNIASKRSELIAEMAQNDPENFDMTAVVSLTTPSAMLETEKFRAMLPNQNLTNEEKMARKLAKYM